MPHPVATSATTFGRSLGGAIGAALFGAILTSRLSVYLVDQLSGSGTSVADIDTNNIQALRALPEPLRTDVLVAYTHAITDIFLLAIPVIVVALIVACFMKEIPLRTHNYLSSRHEPSDAEAEAEVNVPAFTGH